MTIIRRTVALTIATAVCLTAPTGASADRVDGGSPTQRHEAARGELLSVHKVRHMSRAGVDRYLRRAGWSAADVETGVTAYRVVYSTVDVDRRPTRASGLVLIPRNGRKALRTVSYAHGTTSYRESVASRFDDGYLISPGLTYAGAGFATVLPDYLGLGDSPGTHPWMDVPSETTASVDMLRAARQLAHRKGRELKRRTYITGFSQGASAALGLARQLQRSNRRWFDVGAVAPISGAYDMAGVEIPAMLAGRLEPKMTVAYTTYFLVAWNRIHRLYGDPAEVFQRPYASRAEALFDGSTLGDEMLAQLPDTLDELLTPAGRGLLEDPPARLQRALRVADSVCKNWAPKRPVRLLAVRRDEQAATANTRSCARSFRRNGSPTPVRYLRRHTFNGSRHLGSNITGTAAAAKWFLRLDHRADGVTEAVK